jgi:hypothetical protein
MRFLYICPSGGGISTSEMSLEEAGSAIGDNIENLNNAQNGQIFQCWHGDPVV